MSTDEVIDRSVGDAPVITDLSGWMGQLADTDTTGWADRPLHRITMPGCHDAFAYENLFSSTYFGSASNGCAQLKTLHWARTALGETNPIKAQLDLGARYFDIRPTKYYFGRSFSGHWEWRGHHTSEWGGSIQGITFDLNSRLRDLSSWLAANPTEIVIIYLFHYQKIRRIKGDILGRNWGWRYGTPDDQEWIDLYDNVLKQFDKEQIYKSSSNNFDIGTVTYNDMKREGLRKGKAILVFPGLPGALQNGRVGRFGRGAKNVFEVIENDAPISEPQTSFAVDSESNSYIAYPIKSGDAQQIRVGRWAYFSEGSPNIEYIRSTQWKNSNHEVDIPDLSTLTPCVHVSPSKIGAYVFFLFPSLAKNSGKSVSELNLVCLSSDADFQAKNQVVTYLNVPVDAYTTINSRSYFPTMLVGCSETEVDGRFLDRVSLVFVSSSHRVALLSFDVQVTEDALSLYGVPIFNHTTVSTDAPPSETRFRGLSLVQAEALGMTESRWYFSVVDKLYRSDQVALQGAGFDDITPGYPVNKKISAQPDSSVDLAVDAAGVLYLVYLTAGAGGDQLSILFNNSNSAFWQFEETKVSGVLSAPSAYIDLLNEPLDTHNLLITLYDNQGRVLLESTREISINSTPVPISWGTENSPGTKVHSTDKGPDTTARAEGDMTVTFKGRTNDNVYYTSSRNGGQNWGQFTSLGKTNDCPAIATAYYGADNGAAPSAYEVLVYRRTDSKVGVKSRKVAPSYDNSFSISTVVNFSQFGSPAICTRQGLSKGHPSVAIVNIDTKTRNVYRTFYRPDTNSVGGAGPVPLNFGQMEKPKVRQVAVQSHLEDLQDNGHCVLWIAYLDTDMAVWVGRYDSQKDRWVTGPKKVTGVKSQPSTNWNDCLKLDVQLDTEAAPDGSQSSRTNVAIVTLYWSNSGGSASSRRLYTISSTVDLADPNAEFTSWEELNTGLPGMRSPGLARVPVIHDDIPESFAVMSIVQSDLTLCWQIASSSLGFKSNDDNSNFKMYSKNPKTENPSRALNSTNRFYKEWVARKLDSPDTELFNGLYVVQQQSSPIWYLLSKASDLNQVLRDNHSFFEWEPTVFPPNIIQLDAYFCYNPSSFE